AVLGGAAGALAWWGFTVLTEISFGLVAVVIGFLAGHGAVRFAGGKRGTGLQAIAVTVGALSFLVAAYLVNMTFINQTLQQRGEGLLFVLGKAKFVGLLAGALKWKTLATMLLSIGAYAFEWGWAFAAGFVLLIFVHEMGHAVALRREGIPAGAPVFIPFVGAFVAMHGQPRDAAVEARVAMAG